jgi:hypothetical protein
VFNKGAACGGSCGIKKPYQMHQIGVRSRSTETMGRRSYLLLLLMASLPFASPYGTPARGIELLRRGLTGHAGSWGFVSRKSVGQLLVRIIVSSSRRISYDVCMHAHVIYTITYDVCMHAHLLYTISYDVCMYAYIIYTILYDLCMHAYIIYTISYDVCMHI